MKLTRQHNISCTCSECRAADENRMAIGLLIIAIMGIFNEII